MRVRMPSGVKRITVIGAAGAATVARTGAPRRRMYLATEDLKFTLVDPQGRTSRGVVELELGERKRQSRRLKPIEKRIRRLVRTQHKALGRYLSLHDASNRRRRNGWVKELPRNLVRVIRRST